MHCEIMVCCGKCQKQSDVKGKIQRGGFITIFPSDQLISEFSEVPAAAQLALCGINYFCSLVFFLSKVNSFSDNIKKIEILVTWVI